jgi:pimeloyl-ACP methyl ester carboxylesterase
VAVALYRLPSPSIRLDGTRPVLFCHAAGYLGSIWNEVSRRMLTPLPRFALDFRGHGASPPLPEDATWSAFRDDILDATARLGPERPVGVGHSLGGTALLLAEAASPGRFDKLLCYEPILAEEDDPSIADSAARRQERFADRAEAVRRFATRGPLSTLARRVLSDYVDSGLADDADGSVRLRCLPQTEAHVLRTAMSSSWRSALPLVSCDVTMLAGARSVMVTSESLAAAAAAMPRGRVQVFPGAGHLGPLQRPGAFAQYLDSLLAEDKPA